MLYLYELHERKENLNKMNSRQTDVLQFFMHINLIWINILMWNTKDNPQMLCFIWKSDTKDIILSKKKKEFTSDCINNKRCIPQQICRKINVLKSLVDIATTWTLKRT